MEEPDDDLPEVPEYKPKEEKEEKKEKEEKPKDKKFKYKRAPSKVIKLSDKALEQKFLEVFELVNYDYIYCGPKFIPIIPRDDPAVLNKASDYCDDF